MKVLQINVVYKKGSTGKITYELATNLKRNGHEAIICYGRGKRVREEDVYKTASEVFSKVRKKISELTGMHYNKCLFPTFKLIHIIKREQPDIVHIQCINGYFVNIYQFITFLKKSKIPTVLTLHAEFMYTANCPHALECNQWIDGCKKCESSYPRAEKSYRKMKKAFRGFDKLHVVSVSNWLMDRAKRSSILSDFYHETIPNGVDTDVFHYRTLEEINDEIKSIFQGKTVLYVTPNFNDPIKGGNYVLTLAKRMPEIRFIIVGYNGTVTLPNNVVGIKHISDQVELSMYYSMADAVILTSQKETYSMIVVESLCCGAPVVGFFAGAPETIAIPTFSSFSIYADLDQLEDNLKQWLKQDINKVKISSIAVNQYSNQFMYEKYYELYKRMLINE